MTDVGLNGNMTGWEGARQFREREPALPVIYMTGAAADEWASQGGPGSILLAKPFAPAQLVTAVSQLINAAGPPSDAAQQLPIMSGDVRQAELAARLALAESDPTKAAALHLLGLEQYEKAEMAKIGDSLDVALASSDLGERAASRT